MGSAGPKRNEMIKKALTPPMLIPVPPGTVVKKKGSGAVRGLCTACQHRVPWQLVCASDRPTVLEQIVLHG